MREVTYQPSDSRTSSPLASIKSAYGRCGEESTFTVAALRAVGIRLDRSTPRVGLTPTIIMPGSRLGLTDDGIFSERVNLKRC